MTRRMILTRLSSLVVLLAVALANPAGAAETGELAALRQKALDLVNAERLERGLEPLTPGPALDEAAQSHARDMLRRDYYSHVSPEGDTVADRYQDAGGSRWQVTAENIARCRGCPSPPTIGRVEDLHEGWMNSPPHRENILRRGLDRFGFGIVAGDGNTLYAVQTFAGGGTPRGSQPGETEAVTAPEEQTAVALQRINKERRAQSRKPLTADSALVRAASNLVPADRQDDDTLDLQGDPSSALPGGVSGDWRSLATILARCGGCGTRPTAADIRSFVEQWLDDPGYRGRLLDGDLTHFGLTVRANGEGRKTAFAILGRKR